jgi:photosystem II stability/assembly factor-like uncharacterized protein
MSANAGWALTNNALYRSDDAGDSWQDITPPATEARWIGDVFFLNESLGWVESSTGQTQEVEEEPRVEIFRTLDGGQTWIPSILPDQRSLSSGTTPTYLNFADEMHGWLALSGESNANFSYGELFKTTDGGLTWTRLPDPPAGAPVHFVSATNGWMAGGPAGDELYATSDGGQSWQPLVVDLPPAYAARSKAVSYEVPTFTSPEHGTLAVTVTGNRDDAALLFYTTEDGGRSWSVSSVFPSSSPIEFGQRIPSDVVGESLFFGADPQGRRVYIATNRGQATRTTDPQDLPQGVNAIDFSSSSFGWAIVDDVVCAGEKTGCSRTSELLRTTDQGAAWRRLALP